MLGDGAEEVLRAFGTGAAADGGKVFRVAVHLPVDVGRQRVDDGGDVAALERVVQALHQLHIGVAHNPLLAVSVGVIRTRRHWVSVVRWANDGDQDHAKAQAPYPTTRSREPAVSPELHRARRSALRPRWPACTSSPAMGRYPQASSGPSAAQSPRSIAAAVAASRRRAVS